MAIREIIHIPDPVLREISRPVERIDDDVLRLLDDMAATMYDAPGIGLAAIQIGVPLRVVTIDISKRRASEEEDLRMAKKRLPVWPGTRLAKKRPAKRFS